MYFYYLISNILPRFNLRFNSFKIFAKDIKTKTTLDACFFVQWKHVMANYLVITRVKKILFICNLNIRWIDFEIYTYIHTHVCARIYKHTAHTYTRTHAYTHQHTQTHTYTNTHIYTYIYTLHARTHTHPYSYIYIYKLRTYTACVMYACDKCMRASNAYTHTYTYTHKI